MGKLLLDMGHPEVYIVILPAFGIYSEIIPTFARKRLFGHQSMVWATLWYRVLKFLSLGSPFLHNG